MDLLMPVGHPLFLFSVDGHNGLSAVRQLLLMKYPLKSFDEDETLVD